MAMNKKEQAAFDAAIKEVYVARALNWTEPVACDVPVPTSMKQTRGFTFNAYNGGGISFALSSGVGHATSRDSPPQKTTTQRGIPMYSTRLLALRGLRAALEREYAEKLAKIDIQIQAEKELS